MVFDHKVKFKGKIYNIGEKVPCDVKEPLNKANTKPQEVSETEETLDISELPFVEVPKYTKTEINRMSTADLKVLAKENGLEKGMSGAEIKKALIEKFGL